RADERVETRRPLDYVQRHVADWCTQALRRNRQIRWGPADPNAVKRRGRSLKSKLTQYPEDDCRSTHSSSGTRNLLIGVVSCRPLKSSHETRRCFWPHPSRAWPALIMISRFFEPIMLYSATIPGESLHEHGQV